MKKAINNVRANLQIMDLEAEYKMGVYSNALEPLGPGEAYVTESLLIVLGLEVGDLFYIGFHNLALNEKAYDLADIKDISYGEEEFTVVLPLRLKKALNVSKLSDSSNPIIIDFKGLREYMKPFILEQVSSQPQFAAMLSEMELSDYCDMSLINIPNRLEVYLNSNYDQIMETVLPMAAKISELLSPFAIDIKMPIIEALAPSKFSNASVSLIMNIVIVGLLYLSSYVIYNIMMIIVNSKVYDCAVLRTLGMTKGRMLSMMTVYSLIQSSIALVIGFAVCSRVLDITNWGMGDSIPGFSVGYDTKNVSSSVAIAVLLPLYSCLNPLKAVLR